jgi:hypothetical protein
MTSPNNHYAQQERVQRAKRVELWRCAVHGYVQKSVCNVPPNEPDVRCCPVGIGYEMCGLVLDGPFKAKIIEGQQ